MSSIARTCRPEARHSSDGRPDGPALASAWSSLILVAWLLRRSADCGAALFAMPPPAAPFSALPPFRTWRPTASARRRPNSVKVYEQASESRSAQGRPRVSTPSDAFRAGAAVNVRGCLRARARS